MIRELKDVLDETGFERELRELIEKHQASSDDHMLPAYIARCMDTWNHSLLAFMASSQLALTPKPATQAENE